VASSADDNNRVVVEYDCKVGNGWARESGCLVRRSVVRLPLLVVEEDTKAGRWGDGVRLVGRWFVVEANWVRKEGVPAAQVAVHAYATRKYMEWRIRAVVLVLVLVLVLVRGV